MKITVIGGLCLDITALARAPLRAADSNPAKVHLSAGGVGRNIAENLHRLGAATFFVSAVGDDGQAEILRGMFAESGLDSGHLIRRPGMGTGVYIDLLEPSGSLYTAANDMEIVESISPEDAENIAPLIAASNLLVMDANLPPETLAALARIAKKAGCPVLADSVSAFKAERLRPALKDIALLKTNRAEAAVLAGRPLDGEKAVREACAALLAEGPGEIHITLGAEGSVSASAGAGTEPEIVFLPVLPGEKRNVNGAGDAFGAGVAFSFCAGGKRGPAENALFGAACAAITIESDRAVSPAISLAGVRARLEQAGYPPPPRTTAAGT